MASAPRSFRRLIGCAAALVAAGAVVSGTVGCKQEKQPTVIKPRYTDLPPKVVPEYLKQTIYALVDTEKTAPLNVNDFGLVANLAGPTGDGVNVKMIVKEYILKQMVKNGFGSKRTPGLEGLAPEEMLRDPRVAVVRVDGLVPAGARKGQRFDIAVSALDNNDTSSLRGGVLYRTDLKINGADPNYPGVAIDEQAVAEGPIFVNPSYALSDATSNSAAKASLRYGVVLDGGVVLKDRAIVVSIRAPQLAMSRRIQWCIQEHFHDVSVAAAYDERYIQLYMPRSFGGDWEHFAGLATHLYFNNSPEFAATMARRLADEAQKPDAPLMDISYCWEGLGSIALPHIVPLMNHSSPDIAFAAARAAVYLNDSSAQGVLLSMARSAHHPFQLSAVQVLGSLPPSPVIKQMLRTLLDSQESTVRIEAYRLLAAMDDGSIYTHWVGPPGRKFALDIIDRGEPLIYASRRGTPRIAIFGGKPSLDLPISFATMDNRLTITADPGEHNVKIFYREPGVLRPAPVMSRPDVAELIARLAGEGAEGSPQKFDFSYSDVVAIVQTLTQGNRVTALASLTAGSGGSRVPTPFVLQALPRVQEEILSAPAIPELGRPQGNGPATAPADAVVPPATNDSGTNRAQARK